MKSLSASNWMRFENHVALKVMAKILEKTNIRHNIIQTMFANGDSEDTTAHYILKELEKKYEGE